MNILVCTDLSNNSTAVIETAQAFAVATSAKIWLIHVVNPDQGFIGYEDAALSQIGVLEYGIDSQSNSTSIRDFISKKLHQNHQRVQTISKKFRLTGIDTTALMIRGRTAGSILKLTEKLNADMVILGTPQHSVIHKLLLGSISQKILHSSKVPILCVPY